MDILQILVVVLVVSIIAVVLREIRSEYSLLAVLGGGTIILLSIMPGFIKLIETIQRAAESAEINTSYVKIVIKSSGIACVTAICSEMCRDMGQSAMAAKAELAGRVAIMLTALPAVNALLEVIGSTI